MTKPIIGRQVRQCAPGGFTAKKARMDPRCGRVNASEVREAANRVLERRGELNAPNAWESPALKRNR